jgi:hypothetical protein
MIYASLRGTGFPRTLPSAVTSTIGLPFRDSFSLRFRVYLVLRRVMVRMIRLPAPQRVRLDPPSLAVRQ